jgi:hypothetical protein
MGQVCFYRKSGSSRLTGYAEVMLVNPTAPLLPACRLGSGVPRESYCCYCGFGSLDGGTIPLVRM